MMRSIPLLLFITVCVTLLIGCEDNSTSDNAEATNQEITGEIYDTGKFRVLIPDGWTAFPIADVFADAPGTVNTSCVNIIKDGESDRDVHSKPYIRLTLYDSPEMLPSSGKEFLTGVEDVGPMQLGDHIWSGYAGEDHFGGYNEKVLGKLASLLSQEGEVCFDATIRLSYSSRKQKITLEDRDVQAILASAELSDSASAIK